MQRRCQTVLTRFHDTLYNQDSAGRSLSADRNDSQDRIMSPQPFRHRTSLIPVCALLLTLVARPAAAQPAAVEGLIIPVENPITEDVAGRIKNVTAAVVRRHRDADPRDAGKAALKIVLDFTPNGASANSTAFGGCYDLAKHLLSLHDVTTIAFVHGDVKRHAVLPVLACKEIVMSSEAKLGPVVGDGDRPLDGAEEAAYRLVIDGRNRIPAPVLKLLDPSMEVLEARRRPKGDIWFIDARRVAEEEKAGNTVANPGAAPVVGKGAAEYTPTQAKSFGLCQLVRESRQEVAEAYQLPAASLRENPLLDGPPVVWKVTLIGPVNMAMHESLKRRARNAIGGRDKKHANFLIVQLECSGGDLDAAYAIAKMLRSLKQDDGKTVVKTIAYVPGRAPDTAAIIALGCNEIVLGRTAQFGDFSAFVEPPGELPRRIETLRQFAQEQSYSPLLVQGFLDRDLTILSAKSIRGAAEWRLMTPADLEKDRAGKEPHWELRTQIKPPGQLLVLNAETAKDIGFVRHVVDSTPQLYEALGVKESQVTLAGSDWIDELLYFLRRPEVSVLLVLVGFICMILEFKIPGVTLPGVIAAICFVLFFYAWSPVAGQATWLAILLFLLALVMIALEIFVLPGFGLVGVSGAILLVLSLALVTLEKQPKTSLEWQQFGTTVLTFTGCLVGAMIAGFTFIWYLPNIPYLNRLMLRPSGLQLEPPEALDSLQPLARLLGDIGVAATPLRPAGKVKFGDEFIDVVSEGSFVPEGTRVQVIEIEGTRIVVKEV